MTLGKVLVCRQHGEIAGAEGFVSGVGEDAELALALKFKEAGVNRGPCAGELDTGQYR